MVITDLVEKVVDLTGGFVDPDHDLLSQREGGGESPSPGGGGTQVLEFCVHLVRIPDEKTGLLILL